MKLSPTLSTPAKTLKAVNGQLPVEALAARFESDMPGADLDALKRFGDSLPKAIKPALKNPKKPGEEEELLGEVVSDYTEWQVAQAETGAAAAGAAGAEAAAAGAAGAEAAAAGAAGAAGAGSAIAVVSPLALTPAALLLNDGSTPNRAPELLKPAYTVYLPVNAGTGPVECSTPDETDFKDVDNTFASLKFYFVVDGQYVLTDRIFAIDEETGTVSLTNDDYDLACAKYTLTVVAFDGQAYSAPQTITVERVLPDLLEGAFGTNPDTYYSLTSMTSDETPYADNVDVDVDPSKKRITINDEVLVNGEETFNTFDILGLEKNVVWSKLYAERDGDQLRIRLRAVDDDSLNLKITINNHYSGIEKDSVTSTGHGAIEYLHFDSAGLSSYAGYALSALPSDTVDSDCDGNTFFPENGSYRIATVTAVADRGELIGTVCDDLIAGSRDVQEHLKGLSGNDLLFANGHDTLEGGAGNDLLALRGHGNKIVFAAAGIENGSDVVVGFGEDDDHHDDHHDDQCEDDDHKPNHIVLTALDGSTGDSPVQGVVNDGSFDEEVNGDAVSYTLHVDEDEVATVLTFSAGDETVQWFVNALFASPDETLPSVDIHVGENFRKYFLVEDGVGNTHLFLADAGMDSKLSLNELTHMAQFTDTSLCAFSADNVWLMPMPASPAVL